jgi:hypothetical protein
MINGKSVVLSPKTVQINRDYKVSHDAMTTIYAMSLLLFAAYLIMGSFYLYLFPRLDSNETSLFGIVFTTPNIIIGAVGFVSLISFYSFWGSNGNFTRVLMLTVGTLAFVLAGWVLLSGNPGLGTWKNGPVSFDIEGFRHHPERYPWVFIAVLSMVGVWSSSVRGTLRVDRLRMYDASFFALMLAVISASYIMCIVSSLIYKTAHSYTDSEGMLVIAYIGLVSVFAVGCIMAMRLGEHIAEWFTGPRDPRHHSITISEIVHSTTSRTISALRYLLIMVFTLPPLLIWWVRSGITLNEEEELEPQWRFVATVAGVSIALLPVLAMFANEFAYLSPGVYNLVATTMSVVVVGLLAMNSVYWRRDTGIALAIAFTVTMVSFAGGVLHTSVLARSLFLAGLFVTVKHIGQVTTDYIEANIQGGAPMEDSERLMVWSIPIALIGLAWLAQSHSSHQSYTSPLLFFFFSLFYVLVYYWPNRDTEDRTYITGSSREANIAIDFFVLFGVIAMTLASTNLLEEMAERLFTIPTDRNPLIRSIVSFLALVAIAFGAASGYHFAQTDESVSSIVFEMQRNAWLRNRYLSEDVERATSWRKIADIFGIK